MAAAGAAPVDGLAVAGAQHVDLAGVRERLEGAVDGGQADRVAPVLEHVVQVLRAAELVDLVERGRDRGPLPGGTAPHGMRRWSPGASLSVACVGRCRAPVRTAHCARPSGSGGDPAGGAGRGRATSRVPPRSGRGRRRARRPASGAASAVTTQEDRHRGEHDAGPGRHVRRSTRTPCRPATPSTPIATDSASVQANAAGQLLGGRDRDHHQRADQQQADHPHRDGDGDRGRHREQQVQRPHRQPADPGELLVLADREQLPPQPERSPAARRRASTPIADVLRARP